MNIEHTKPRYASPEEGGMMDGGISRAADATRRRDNGVALWRDRNDDELDAA